MPGALCSAGENVGREYYGLVVSLRGRDPSLRRNTFFCSRAMPLIEITSLPQRPGARARVLDAIVVHVAAALGRPPESVWALWQEVPSGAYAVGASRPHVQPRETHPPVVRVYARRTPEEMEWIVRAIESVVQRELDLDPFVIAERAE